MTSETVRKLDMIVFGSINKGLEQVRRALAKASAGELVFQRPWRELTTEERLARRKFPLDLDKHSDEQLRAMQAELHRQLERRRTKGQ